MIKKKKIGQKKKIAFVCSGGAAKAGAFHLGVALALQEHGFKFYGGLREKDQATHQPGPMDISTYVGSSAGSIISSYLASGYSLENIFNSFLQKKSADEKDNIPKTLPRMTYQKMFNLTSDSAATQIKELLKVRKIISKVVQGGWESLVGLKWLQTNGLFSTAGIENYLNNEVLPSNQFEDYLADLFIVATQLNHSRKVVFGKYHYEPPPNDLTCQYSREASISQACAASTALPFIFAPYGIEGKNKEKTYYIDGEIRDTLSSHVAVDAGADLIFASYTHQPYHMSEKIGSLTEHGLSSILVQSIYLLVEQKINNQIHNKKTQRNAIDAVSHYCKKEGLEEEHRKQICSILEAELHHRMNVDWVYIHPKPSDSKMFIREHFSLAPKKMEEIVKSGFKAALDVLRHYNFDELEASDKTTELTK